MEQDLPVGYGNRQNHPLSVPLVGLIGLCSIVV